MCGVVRPAESLRSSAGLGLIHIRIGTQLFQRFLPLPFVVHQVEALAKDRGKKSGKSVSKRALKSPDTLALERRVSDALGLAVTVDHRGNGGVLQIHYRSLDQLDDVLRRLSKN